MCLCAGCVGGQDGNKTGSGAWCIAKDELGSVVLAGGHDPADGVVSVAGGHG